MTDEKLIKNYKVSYNYETGELNMNFKFYIPESILEGNQEEFIKYLKHGFAEGLFGILEIIA